MFTARKKSCKAGTQGATHNLGLGVEGTASAPLPIHSHADDRAQPSNEVVPSIGPPKSALEPAQAGVFPPR